MSYDILSDGWGPVLKNITREKIGAECRIHGFLHNFTIFATCGNGIWKINLQL